MKLKSPKTKEQFGHHPKNWEKHSYPNYEKYGAKQVEMPELKHVEFGKAFDIPIQAVIDQTMVQTAYQTVIADFFKTKADNFPTWTGLPMIKTQEPIDSLRRIYRIGWYAAVPKTFVINPDDKLEEDLWNS